MVLDSFPGTACAKSRFYKDRKVRAEHAEDRVHYFLNDAPSISQLNNTMGDKMYKSLIRNMSFCFRLLSTLSKKDSLYKCRG